MMFPNSPILLLFKYVENTKYFHYASRIHVKVLMQNGYKLVMRKGREKTIQIFDCYE